MRAVEEWRNGANTVMKNPQKESVTITTSANTITGKDLAMKLAKELDDQQSIIFNHLEKQKEIASKKLYDHLNSSRINTSRSNYYSDEKYTNDSQSNEMNEFKENNHSDQTTRFDEHDVDDDDDDALSQSPSMHDRDDEDINCNPTEVSFSQSHVEISLVESKLGNCETINDEYYVDEGDD